MSNREKAINYAKENYSLFRSNLEEFVRIPSISTSIRTPKGIRTAAQFVEKLLIQLASGN